MRLNAVDYALAWYQALKKSKESDWDKITGRFLRHLLLDGKLDQLDRITDEMRRLEEEDKDLQSVEITLAHEFKPEMIADLAKKIMQTDKQLEIKTKVDKELLGGLIIETKDSRWNLSLKNQLHQLQSSLKS